MKAWIKASLSLLAQPNIPADAFGAAELTR
jgi:hypothetical protein